AEQINLNNIAGNCVVEQLAISDRCGIFRFIVPGRNANAHLEHLVAPHTSEDGDTILVKTVTLDEYVRRGPRPSLVKMDIEGAEVAALTGAAQLLHYAGAPKFLISTHSDELERQVKQLLQQNGYS